MLFLQQVLVRLFRDNLRHSFWRWCGDTKHKQVEEAKAIAKQTRRNEKRAAIRIQRWYKKVFFKHTMSVKLKQYKQRLERIQARKEAALEKKRQEKLAFIRWRTEKRGTVLIQKAWRALRANHRKWRRFVRRRRQIRLTIPIMKRLRVMSFLLRWIRRKLWNLRKIQRRVKRE